MVPSFNFLSVFQSDSPCGQCHSFSTLMLCLYFQGLLLEIVFRSLCLINCVWHLPTAWKIAINKMILLQNQIRWLSMNEILHHVISLPDKNSQPDYGWGKHSRGELCPVFCFLVTWYGEWWLHSFWPRPMDCDTTGLAKMLVQVFHNILWPTQYKLPLLLIQMTWLIFKETKCVMKAK